MMTTTRVLSVLAAFSLASSVSAQTAERARIDRQMLELSLQDRVEQRCDRRAAGRVAAEHAELKPDTTIAYAFADTKARGTEVVAPGAALRSNGHWYRLSYKCRTTPDGLDIESFDYKLGAEIPRAQWEEHGLY